MEDTEYLDIPEFLQQDAREKRANGSASNSTGLLCVISLHEKGFWQADVYENGCDDDGVPPIWFATGKIGDERSVICNKALSVFPGIKIVQGVTGCCPECGEEYFDLETTCDVCGCELNEDA